MLSTHRCGVFEADFEDRTSIFVEIWKVLGFVTDSMVLGVMVFLLLFYYLGKGARGPLALTSLILLDYYVWDKLGSSCISSLFGLIVADVAGCAVVD